MGFHTYTGVFGSYDTLDSNRQEGRQARKVRCGWHHINCSHDTCNIDIWQVVCSRNIFSIANLNRTNHKQWIGYNSIHTWEVNHSLCRHHLYKHLQSLVGRTQQGFLNIMPKSPITTHILEYVYDNQSNFSFVGFGRNMDN